MQGRGSWICIAPTCLQDQSHDLYQEKSLSLPRPGSRALSQAVQGDFRQAAHLQPGSPPEQWWLPQPPALHPSTLPVLPHPYQHAGESSNVSTTDCLSPACPKTVHHLQKALMERRKKVRKVGNRKGKKRDKEIKMETGKEIRENEKGKTEGKTNQGKRGKNKRSKINSSKKRPTSF